MHSNLILFYVSVKQFELIINYLLKVWIISKYIELDLQARIGCSLFAQYKTRNNVDVMSVGIKYSMKL